MVNIWLMMVSIWLMMVNILSGCWLSPTPLKNDGVKVSWDDDIPNIWKNAPNHQPDYDWDRVESITHQENRSSHAPFINMSPVDRRGALFMVTMRMARASLPMRSSRKRMGFTGRSTA